MSITRSLPRPARTFVALSTNNPNIPNAHNHRFRNVATPTIAAIITSIGKTSCSRAASRARSAHQRTLTNTIKTPSCDRSAPSTTFKQLSQPNRSLPLQRPSLLLVGSPWLEPPPPPHEPAPPRLHQPLSEHRDFSATSQEEISRHRLWRRHLRRVRCSHGRRAVRDSSRPDTRSHLSRKASRTHRSAAPRTRTSYLP